MNMESLVPFLCVGLLFIAVSVPMIIGAVPPNRFYGFRVKKTVNDPKIWYPANKYCGWALSIAGAVLIGVGAVIALLLPTLDFTAALAVFAPTLLALTSIAVIMSFRYLRTL